LSHFRSSQSAQPALGGSAAALDVPSLSGNTGILELGLSVKPSAASPWTADIGVKPKLPETSSGRS